MARAWQRGEREESGRQNPPREPENPILRLRSKELEAGLVAALVSDPNVMAEVVEIVKPGDMAVEPYCTAYEIGMQLWQERIPMDLPVLAGRMEPDEFAEVMHHASENYTASAYWEYYAREIVKLAQRREAIQRMTRAIGKIVEEPDIDVPALITDVNQKVIRQERDIRAVRMADAAEKSMERLRGERDGTIVRRTVTSGYRDVDKMLGGGFEPGDLIILAARPSVGKTLLAMDMLVNSTETPGQVSTGVMFSAEMSTDSLVRRLGSRLSGVSLTRIRSGDVTDQEFVMVEDALNAVKQFDMVVDDTPGITVDQMMLTIQRTQVDSPVGFVVFDYLELAGDGQNGRLTETERMGMVVRRMKEMAMLTEVPVMALSQVGRQVEHRTNKVPMMSDIRLSSVIEATADQVIFLYNHSYYVERQMEQFDARRAGIMELHVAKNRNGSVGQVNLGYDATNLTFVDLADGPLGE